MNKLRDRLLDAPETLDPRVLPPAFMEARAMIRKAIARAGRSGISDEALLAVLMSEALPRMMQLHGPAWAGAMLAHLGTQIGAGAAPGCKPQ